MIVGITAILCFVAKSGFLPISVYDFAKRHAPDNIDVDALPFKDVVGESESTCADSTPLKELGWNAV